MYNGIGLTTPRGSGTNGYVIRNLSTLRSHESSQDRASAWDTAPPKHREPDEGILEHERKRKVEVKCLELQLELEDKGVEEMEIEEQVGALRAKLLENLAAFAPAAKSLKTSDTHGLALAKKAELSKMARAFGTRSDYTEGDAFDREKQEENKIKRQTEREEKERKREEDKIRMIEQKANWEAERRERDRLRRREEDRLRKEREQSDSRRRDTRMPPPLVPHSRIPDGPRERREPYRRGDRRSRSKSPPPRRRDLSGERARRTAHSPPSRSASPPPRTRRRFDTRSPTPSRSRSRSRSPPTRGRHRSPSPPPHSLREISPPTSPRRNRKGSFSPPRRPRTRSPSPHRGPGGRGPPRSRNQDSEMDGGKRSEAKPRSITPSPRRGRARSASTGSSMSVSTGSGRSSRSRSRD